MNFSVSLIALLFVSSACEAQEVINSLTSGFPALNVSQNMDGETQYSLSLQILALMTSITVLPSLVLGMTSFTRVIIVLSILRQAMGTQQTPPNQVLIAIALFLTFFIMSPTLSLINNDAISPYLNETKSAETALADGSKIIKNFELKNLFMLFCNKEVDSSRMFSF